MKREKGGFTLVELLVVMAIIAILASIVVPNVAAYLRRAQATRAQAECKSIELALTKMLSDSNRASLADLFIKTPGASVPNRVGSTTGLLTAAQYRVALEVYTNVLYALLREGRAVLNGGGTVPQIGGSYAALLDKDAVNRLGGQYLDIGSDPFGQLYKIFPGPWPSSNGPIPFRKYLADSNTNLPGTQSTRTDDLTSITVGGTPAPNTPDNVIDPESEQEILVGFPAPRDKIAFIWSTGFNTINGQAIYDTNKAVQSKDLASATDGYANQRETNYETGQDDFQMFGGDDVNNWDPGRSWERFY